jgi:hypothetical protein
MAEKSCEICGGEIEGADNVCQGCVAVTLEMKDWLIEMALHGLKKGPPVPQSRVHRMMARANLQYRVYEAIEIAAASTEGG